MTRLQVFAVLLAACIVNALPLLDKFISGDFLFHLALIDCMGRQLWEGQLYPRWCFDADAGLGSPLLVFYFPLAYYVSALFYPLHLAGGHIYWVYACGVTAFTLLTALTGYAWLRSFTERRFACIATVALLFSPYRLEMMMGRCDFSELAFFSLAPLGFLAARRIAHGQKGGAALLAFAVMLMALCHVPATLCAVLGMTAYFALTVRNPKRWGVFILAGCAGAAATFWYAVPAAYFQGLVTAGGDTFDKYWPNRAVSIAGLEGIRLVFILDMLISYPVFFLLAFAAWRRRGEVRDACERHEMLAWVAVGTAAFVTVFDLPPAAWFWAAVNGVAHIGMPWRMNGVLAFAIIALLAIYLQRLYRRPKPAGDAMLAAAFLIVLPQMMTASIPHEKEREAWKYIAAFPIPPLEYRTVWTDAAHYGHGYALDTYFQERRTRVEVAQGRGEASVVEWSAQGIILNVKAREPLLLRVHHRYFPVWKAEGAELSPEEGSGMLLLRVEAGERRVTIRPRPNMELLHMAWDGWMKPLPVGN